MAWKIIDNRIAYQQNDSIIFPNAEDIFTLNRNESVSNSVLADATPPVDELKIRFSRLSAKIKICLDFDIDSQAIVLSLIAFRGKLESIIQYDRSTLQDSVIMNDTWYSLLNDYPVAKELLENASITQSGSISLPQYAKLKRETASDNILTIEDKAGEYLSSHPMRKDLAEAPTKLNANLYPYQQHGYQWMQFIASEQCGCILGDEMGLGKTLQVIALLTKRKQEGYGPALVIAPVSLLENWKREFGKFTTGMNVFVHHGPHRTGLFTDLKDFDVVIISYNTAVSDMSMLKMICWDSLVIDEAQNIKNPAAVRTRAIKELPRTVAIAVTGTPFENHLTDIWSIMDFILPNYLGKLSAFQTEFSDDLDGAEKLEPFITPFMLRRRVMDVAQDLPPRIDIPQTITLSQGSAEKYEAVRQQILQDYGGAKASLPMLQKLRMYCTHPALLEHDDVKDPIQGSEKYERLCELLEEIISLKEKAILFTSYNGMFEILRNDIPRRFGIKIFEINGSTDTSDRQPIIDEFSSTIGSALLVLNPRAAGTGLNITAASRVIHYNLEWNPALEDQASARAYRRGQTRTVFVYRLYYKGTVEEIINERIDKKREMSGAAVLGTDGKDVNSEDIMRALMISPGGVLNE